MPWKTDRKQAGIFALASEDMKKLADEERVKYPFRRKIYDAYCWADTRFQWWVLNPLGRAWRWPVYMFNRNHQYHLIRPPTLEPGEYYDWDVRILHSVMHMVVDCYEWEIRDRLMWDRDYVDDKQDPSLMGIMHPDEINKNVVPITFMKKNHKALIDAYWWWKYERPNIQRDYHIMLSAQYNDWPGDIYHPDTRVVKTKDVSDTMYELEDYIDQQDEYHLTQVMKYRKYMWN